MATLRLPSEEKFYQNEIKNRERNFCFLCEKDLLRKEFRYWYICENRYPYTKIAKKHDLLACKRHIRTIDELTNNEIQEFLSLWMQINNRQLGNYDQMSWNVPDRQSAPFHLHMHLVELK